MPVDSCKRRVITRFCRGGRQGSCTLTMGRPGRASILLDRRVSFSHLVEFVPVLQFKVPWYLFVYNPSGQLCWRPLDKIVFFFDDRLYIESDKLPAPGVAETFRFLKMSAYGSFHFPERGGEGRGREGKGGEEREREGKGGEGRGRERKGGEGRGREGKGGEGRGRERKGGEGRGREGMWGESKGGIGEARMFLGRSYLITRNFRHTFILRFCGNFTFSFVSSVSLCTGYMSKLQDEINTTYHLNYSNTVSKSCFYGTRHRCLACHSNAWRKLNQVSQKSRLIYDNVIALLKFWYDVACRTGAIFCAFKRAKTSARRARSASHALRAGKNPWRVTHAPCSPCRSPSKRKNIMPVLQARYIVT